MITHWMYSMLTSFPWTMRWCTVTRALNTTTQLLLLAFSERTSARCSTLMFVPFMCCIRSELRTVKSIKTVKCQGLYLKSNLFDQDANHQVILPFSRKVTWCEGSVRHSPCSGAPCWPFCLHPITFHGLFFL